MNTFTINEIPITIDKIIPIKINNDNNFIEKIHVEYIFDFVEACDPSLNIKMKEAISIDVQTYKEDVFVDIENINAEFFYEIAKERALENSNILKRVKFVRIRTGLDIEPNEANNTNNYLYKPL